MKAAFLKDGKGAETDIMALEELLAFAIPGVIAIRRQVGNDRGFEAAALAGVAGRLIDAMRRLEPRHQQAGKALLA